MFMDIDRILDELERVWIEATELGESLALVCNEIGFDVCEEKVIKRIEKWIDKPTAVARLIVFNYQMILKRIRDHINKNI